MTLTMRQHREALRLKDGALHVDGQWRSARAAVTWPHRHPATADIVGQFVSMAKVAAMELGQRVIRVNSVHPGVIDTQMVRDKAGEATIDIAPTGNRVALRRVGQPEEIADLVVFLGSDESLYCTGAEFVADGGATATHSRG
jgi:NAD(P)-dependent dehydrogenase (short-subunit alcohol dehydrogenase family)